MQVSAEICDLLEPAKAHRGNSEPLFLLYRVRHLMFGRGSSYMHMFSHRFITFGLLPLSQV